MTPDQLETGASSGRVELLAVKFTGNAFSIDIIALLNELFDRGTARIVDLVFASRSHAGDVYRLPWYDLDLESFAAVEPLVEDNLGILSNEDVQRMGAVLDNGSSAGLLLFEHLA